MAATYVLMHRYSDSNITGENGIVLVVIRHNNLTGDDCILSAVHGDWAKAYGTRFNIPLCHPTGYNEILAEVREKQQRCTFNGKVDDACMNSSK